MTQKVDQERGAVEGPARERKLDGLARKLRRDIYKALPAATWSLVQQVDPEWSSAETLAYFAAHQDAGVDSRGAACAMQRACQEHSLRAWCYEFGDPAHFTHMAVLVETEESHLQLHDPYLDLEGDGDLLAMLDRIGKGDAVKLKGGTATRNYVVDAGLEDEAGRAWLGVGIDADRGSLLQVRGGLALLEGTHPGYRALQASLGATPLTALLAHPVALLNPAGDDARDLAQQLGLKPGPSATPAESVGERPSLFARANPSIGTVQEHLVNILDQVSMDRSRVLEQLMTLQSRTIQLSGELTTALLAAEQAAAAEKQAHDALQQLSERHEQVLHEIGARNNETAQASELVIQLRAELDATRAQMHAAADGRQLELESARAEARRLAEAIGAAEAAARQSGEAAEAHRLQLSSARDEVARLGEALAAAEAAARESGEAADVQRGEAARAAERLAQIKAELDDMRAEAQRLTEALREETGARRSAEAAAEYREELSQLTNAIMAAADERQSELEAARLEMLRLTQALSAAETEAQLVRETAAGHQAEVARLTAQLLASADERRLEVENSHAQRQQLAVALGAAEAEARLRGDAAAAAGAELSGLSARLLSEGDEHRRELEEAQSQTRQVTAALSAAELDAQRRAEAADALQLEVARTKQELETAALEARLHQDESRRARAQLDSVEADLRRQLAEALTALESAPQNSAFAGSPRSMLGAMTPGDVGVTLPDGAIGVRGDQSGCLCYGPYIDLAPGRYRISIAIDRPTLAQLLPSRAIVEIVDGSDFLSRQDLRLQSSRTNLTLDFAVPPSPHPRQIEFRILVGRRSFAKLRGLILGGAS